MVRPLGGAGRPRVLELTAKRAIISRLRTLGVTPRKRLGQNFLVDSDVLAQIAAEVEKAAPHEIIEIGAGLGTVTRKLRELAVRVIAVELDHRLAAALEEDFASFRNVEIIEKDFLELDLKKLGKGPYYVVGNLPYRITSPILAKLVQGRERITHALLLTQEEVAQKIMDSPGVHGSALGVFVNAYASLELLHGVPKTSFYPVPQVDSALWRMEFLDRPRFTADKDTFFALVRAIYGKRRKMLRRALRDLIPTNKVDKILNVASISPTRRGETLSIAELDRLAHAIFDQRSPD